MKLPDEYSIVPKDNATILNLTNLYLSKMDLANLSEEEFVLKYADVYLKIRNTIKSFPIPKARITDSNINL